MRTRAHILLCWLGICSSQLVCATSCPTDSVIVRDQNDNKIGTTIYQYDEAGREILEESTKFPNGTITQGTRTITSYYESGKVHEKSTWQWSSTTNDWIGEERNVYTYNDKGSILSWEVYTWNNGWINKSKTETTYDDKNRQTLYITYKGSGTQWIPSTKSESAYDKAGHKILERTWKSYNTSTNKWEGSSWTNWEYNSTTCPSKNTMIEQYTWNGKTWSGISKYDYEYDQWANQTLIRFYSQYNTTNSTWIPSYEHHYAYDVNKNQTLIEEYIYNNNEYVGTKKEEYVFDAQGNILTTIIYAWDNTNKKWIGQSNETNIYDNQNRLIEHITKSWGNNAWIEQSRTTYLFPTSNTTQTITWTWTNSQWTESTRETITTANGKTTLEQKEVWNGSSWVGDTKTEYTYSGNILTKKTTFVWDASIPDWVISGYTQSIYTNNQLTEEISYTYIGGLPMGNSRITYTYGDTQATTTFAWNAITTSWDTTAYVAKKYQNKLLIEEDDFVYKDCVLTSGSKTLYNYTDTKNYTAITYIYSNPNWVEDELIEKSQNSTTTSTATYQWQNNTWVGKEKTSDINYTDGSYKATFTYQWGNAGWQDYLKQEHFYDAYGNDTLFIDAQFSNDTWSWLSTSTRWELTLNDQQQVLLDAHYTWNSTLQCWASQGTKIEYQYDQYGNVNYELRWVKSGIVWAKNSLKEWVYDSKGNVIEAMTYSVWSQTYWRSGTKTEAAYTDWGQKYIDATYQWNRTTWRGLNKTERLYNDKHEEIAYFTYVWRTDHWEYSYKYEKEYDERGNLTKQIIYRYNASINDWTYYSKNEYFYDANNIKTGEILYGWQNNDWQLQYKSVTTYDANANRLQRTNEVGTWSNGIVQNYELTTYYYACDPKITINVQTKDSSEGQTTGGGTYIYYAHVQISAIEAPNCYTFSHWDDGNTDATRTVVVTENKTYTAIFTPIDHPVHASVKGGQGGSVAITINE